MDTIKRYAFTGDLTVFTVELDSKAKEIAIRANHTPSKPGAGYDEVLMSIRDFQQIVSMLASELKEK